MTRRRHVVGLSWSDIASAGQAAFPYIHAAGSGVLSAFGAGALVQPITTLEQRGGLLPATPPTSIATVGYPDFGLVIFADTQKPPVLLKNPASVNITGGKRFDGNGYASGDPISAGRFSFGYDAPASVDVDPGSGKKHTTYSSVARVVFGGGIEARTTLEGLVGSNNFDTSNQGDNMDTFTALTVQAGVVRNRIHSLTSAAAMTPESFNEHAQDCMQALARLAQQLSSLPSNAPRDSWYSVARSRTLDLEQHVLLFAQRHAQSSTLSGDAAQLNLMAAQLSGTISNYVVQARSALFQPKPRPVNKLPPTPRRGLISHVLGAIATAIKPSSSAIVKSQLQQEIQQIQRQQPSHGYVIKTTPKGRQFTSLQINRGKRRSPQKTIQAARTVAQRAQQVGQAALARVAQAKSATAKKATIVGAAAVKPRQLTLAALEQQATALVAAGKKLSTQVDKYQKVVSNQAAQSKAAQLRAQQVTHIHGYGAVLGWLTGNPFYDIAGAVDDEVAFIEDVLGDMYAPVPDPTRPGYLTDGSPDPAYGGGYGVDPTTGLPYGGVDPTTGLPYGSGGDASTMPGPPDYGAGTPPALAGNVITMSDGTTWPAPNVDYMPDPYPNGDDPTFYDCPTDDDLPLGAIVFDGSRQPPHMGLGNFSVFFGMVPGAAPPKGGPNSGYALHGDGKWWLELKGTQPSTGYSGGHNYDTVSNPDSAMVAESQKNNWGPLIGNPQGGFTHGLRFSPSGPSGARWFWYFDTAAAVAPWAVQAILQAELNDAITQYKAAVTAGQTDYVNAQLQDKLSAQQAQQQAQQQAAVDAQVQQAQEIADQQSAAQEQQMEQQQMQQQLQQQAFMQQQAQQQAQFDQQAQQLQLQYFSQHPDAMFQPADDGSAAQPSSLNPDYGTMHDNGDPGDPGNIDWGTDQYADPFASDGSDAGDVEDVLGRLDRRAG